MRCSAATGRRPESNSCGRPLGGGCPRIIQGVGSSQDGLSLRNPCGCADGYRFAQHHPTAVFPCSSAYGVIRRLASVPATAHLFPGAPGSTAKPGMSWVKRRITANGYPPYDSRKHGRRSGLCPRWDSPATPNAQGAAPQSSAFGSNPGNSTSVKPNLPKSVIRDGYSRPIRWSHSCCTTLAWKPSTVRSMGCPCGSRPW